eukprot:s3170_g8.t1
MDVTRSTTLRAAAFIEQGADLPGSPSESGTGLRESAAQVRAAAGAGREADVAAAVFRLAQQSLVPPFTADSAEFAAAACAAVAGLSEPHLLGKEIGRSHILRVLEELARHVETYQPFVFSFLSRTGYGRITGLDEVARRMQAALSSSSVWLLAAFCRAVGCRRFSSEILWEWANGDSLLIGLLVRNTLTLEALSQSVPETPLQSLLIPPDLNALQTAVVRAFLGLTRPDIAFADVIPTRVEYHCTLEVPAPALLFARHWSRLAVATVETGLVPLLLTAAEGAVCETKLLLSAFLGRLLNAALQDQGVHEGAEELLQACHVAAAHLRDVLNHVCHANRPTKHRDCLQRRNKWSLGGLRNGATPPNLMPCRKQAMHTNALGRCRTSVARTMARLHKTCWGRRGTCLSPCSCMHEFLLQALVDETYHREVFRRLDASWTDEHTQLMLDAAGLAGAHIDCCDLLSWLFGPEKSARAAGSAKAGFSLHEIMPSHETLGLLTERCQALTEAWHGRANIGMLYELFMDMAEHDGHSPYLFRDIPQSRSVDGYVRLLDGQARTSIGQVMLIRRSIKPNIGIQQFLVRVLRWKQRRILKTMFPDSDAVADVNVVKAKAWDLDLGQEEPSLALLMLVRHGCLVESYGQVPHDTRHAAEKFIAESLSKIHAERDEELHNFLEHASKHPGC